MQVKPALMQVMQQNPNRNVSSANPGQTGAGIRVSAQAQALVASVSQNSNLTTAERQGLIEVAAMTDAFVNNPAGRDEIFTDLVGMTVYLSEGEDKGIPRWSVLTGLRFYSGFRTEVPGAAEVQSESVAMRHIKEQIQNIAQQQPVEPMPVVAVKPEVAAPVKAPVAEYNKLEMPEIRQDVVKIEKHAVDVKV